MLSMLRRLAFVVAAVAVVFGLGLAGLPAAPAAPFFFIQLTDPQFGMTTSDAGLRAGDGEPRIRRGDGEPAAAGLRRSSRATSSTRRATPRRSPSTSGSSAGSTRRFRAYSIPGNHDVGNEPTPESLSAYTKRFGPDRFSFTVGSFVGIAINSCLIHTPKNVKAEAEQQDQWLRAELAKARRDGARHIVVFQHHPLFVSDAAEPGGYENIPPDARARLLALFREAGVRHVFAGHYHQNALARDGDLQVVTTGPIGMPLRGAKSGMRIAIVTDAGIEHRYYDLGDLPSRVALPR